MEIRALAALALAPRRGLAAMVPCGPCCALAARSAPPQPDAGRFLPPLDPKLSAAAAALPCCRLPGPRRSLG
eukprot:4746389-Alexandrium_andersonii.AAC.1